MNLLASRTTILPRFKPHAPVRPLNGIKENKLETVNLRYNVEACKASDSSPAWHTTTLKSYKPKTLGITLQLKDPKSLKLEHLGRRGADSFGSILWLGEERKDFTVLSRDLEDGSAAGGEGLGSGVEGLGSRDCAP